MVKKRFDLKFSLSLVSDASSAVLQSMGKQEPEGQAGIGLAFSFIMFLLLNFASCH